MSNNLNRPGTYTASAAWISGNVIDHECEDGAPPIVRDLSTLLADVLAEHSDVGALIVTVEVQR